MITLLTGEIGCGKTTLCRRIIAQARAQGRRVGGIITLPGKFGKEQLWALDVLSGEHRLLAWRLPSPDGLRQGRYHFEADTFAWAIAAVRRALAQGVDLLIVDEIGPLELTRGEGFAPLLEELGQATCPVVISVRRGCAEALEQRLRDSGELVGAHENLVELREVRELRELMELRELEG